MATNLCQARCLLVQILKVCYIHSTFRYLQKLDETQLIVEQVPSTALPGDGPNGHGYILQFREWQDGHH